MCNSTRSIVQHTERLQDPAACICCFDQGLGTVIQYPIPCLKQKALFPPIVASNASTSPRAIASSAQVGYYYCELKPEDPENQKKGVGLG